MKLSAGTIGTLLFTAVATAAFVWMAKRPAVDGSAMNFGMPIQSTAVVEGKAVEDAVPVSNEPNKEEVEPEKMEEATSAPEASAPEPANTDSPAETKTESPVETKADAPSPEITISDDLTESLMKSMDADKVPEKNTPEGSTEPSSN